MIGRMDLITYIKARGGTATPNCSVISDIADHAKCSPRTLYMVVRGHKVPGPKLARRLSMNTGVSVDSLRPDIFGPSDMASINRKRH